MDIQAPVSSIMSTDLKYVGPSDDLMTVKNIFDENDFHHIPVVEDGQIIGIISKSDYLFFLRGYTTSDIDRFIEAAKLRAFKVKEVMKEEVVMLSPEDSVKKALDLFEENRFHCIPIVEKGELKGIVTPLDVIKALNK